MSAHLKVRRNQSRPPFGVLVSCFVKFYKVVWVQIPITLVYTRYLLR